MKKLLSSVIALAMATTLIAGCGSTPVSPVASSTTASTEATTSASASAETSASTEATPEAAKPVTLEVVASQPEYLAQEQEIWKLYTEANPHVTINLTTVNEDTAAAFNTRIAAGNAPDIQSFAGISKDQYKTYQNLQTIDYPYWDKFTYDAKGAFAAAQGTEAGYTPCLQPFSGPSFSFIYYEDEMDKAGLKPRDTVRTMEDLDKFLADLKVYADKNNIPYVLDTGWHSWCWMTVSIDMFATAMGGNQEIMKDLWVNKKIAWTDVEKNPYAAAFTKLKEYYDKGYLPEKWWTRDWEKDFEAGFIAKKSIFTFHGPWLWTKVQSANPDAKLTGMPLPANKDGYIQNYAVEAHKGSVLFECNKTKETQPEAVKAFIWWNSPETLKIRAEAFGEIALMNFGDVGQPELESAQYNTVIKPIQEGFFGDNVNFDSSVWGVTLAGKYLEKGKAQVLADDAMAVTYGKYFEGKISLEDLLKIFEERFNDGYKIP